ncbi:3-hydroxy-3-methylglutaryl-coenzyme A reductase [Dendroctonus ponderosae]|uniref:3-hydroxy-3-methylglutaryl-coenzyme A reductase n=2 Tax=Dendroctonus ponderosae TaxID=77166 RepID=UPI002036574D|nr:3-hydroxy-3-methylglutaryl-coenzyme A reductase [Dendroctonus ponderosae]XP_048522174.1 3-hydroxy-3-methylglutaryl-coenzyme A reductase [Dendroctonus ponderosae]XP_048522175.1 3-hydroxy-3-methylglutaryl-coenzyme A reductase [Dendroctonus ponderosae]
MSKLFRYYGELCATHPWEVIVAVLTLTACFLTVEKQVIPVTQKEPPCVGGCLEEQFHAADMVLMTVIRCLAIMYSYHQFRNLQNLGSKYILGIAGLFVVFSSFVFTSTLLSFLHIDLVDLKDAMFFFLLLIDLSKAATLAQFALTASSTEDISKQIARGVSVLGPTLTLDTLVETLVIGVGTLSGVKRLEMLSYFASLSVIVNYVIFMTFYPACLSLLLELGRISNFYGEKQQFIRKKLLEENDKSNPAVQRVKLIMSFGLLVVHLHSRWGVNDEFQESINNLKESVDCSDDTSFYGFMMKQFVLGADHIVILILLLTLMIKFIFFEPKEQLKEQLEQDVLIELKKDIQSKRSHIRTTSINAESQTEGLRLEFLDFEDGTSDKDTDVSRSLQSCLEIYRTDSGASQLSDKEIMMLVDTKHIPAYNLEKAVQNPERGVKIRRKMIENQIKQSVFHTMPYKDYDYSKVMGTCCENVVGYVPIPLGVAGPLLLDDQFYYIPMATTEGCLVASTNRGCRALEKTGVKSTIVADGMTRGPVVRFPCITKASEVVIWIKKSENFAKVKEQFDSTSRFAKLSKISPHIAGRYLFIRFMAETGDAMGMNMISKGAEKALLYLQTIFNEMEILSLSGNVCTDKKAAAINWIEGRGKSVVCEALVPANIVQSVLKTTTHALIDLNISKNMVGSAMAGSIGGFNAHAANIVTAVYIATGQDAAQNVASSNCITIMEPSGDKGEDLLISCTMPSLEIGTVGGGTILPAQSSCLELLGVKGPHMANPGDNAKQLARIVCGAVLAGELSLMAALASGQLVKSHLRFNRSYSEKEATSSKLTDRSMSCQT